MPRAYVVVGLGYGDEGKGTTVDYLVKRHEIPLVVRFNGGPQAGHNVVLPDGRHHCFSQWGAGTFHGARTHLLGTVLINPWHAFTEAEHLRQVGVPSPFSMLTVSASCPVITPWHIALNRWAERARGSGRHGSCGQGIGETMMAMEAGVVLRAEHLASENLPLRAIHIRDQLAAFAFARHGNAVSSMPEWVEFGGEATAQHIRTLRTYAEVLRGRILDVWEPVGDVVFEGAQGVLLDQRHGEAPYRTWSNCTTMNADSALLDYHGEIVRLGVVRTYMTRHGAGPLRTEAEHLEPEPTEHNAWGEWQGHFRLGYPDFVQLQRAVKACGALDGLALTHIDRGIPDRQICVDYDPDGAPIYETTWRSDPERTFGDRLDLPILVRSFGQLWTSKSSVEMAMRIDTR